MGRGSLVVRRNLWGLSAANMGMVISECDPLKEGRVWKVLWANKHGHRIQDHLEDALVEVEQDAGG